MEFVPISRLRPLTERERREAAAAKRAEERNRTRRRTGKKGPAVKAKDLEQRMYFPDKVEDDLHPTANGLNQTTTITIAAAATIAIAATITAATITAATATTTTATNNNTTGHLRGSVGR